MNKNKIVCDACKNAAERLYGVFISAMFNTINENEISNEFEICDNCKVKILEILNVK